MFCHECGRLNGELVKVCSDCGTELRAVPVKPYARNSESTSVSRSESPGASSLDQYKAIIGPKNQDYYLRHFSRFDRNGETSISWHWPAFFVTFYWLLYRKMWLYALIYFLLPSVVMFVFGLVASVGGAAAGLMKFATFLFYAAVFLAPPLYANALYYRHCQKKIDEAAASSNDPQRQLGELSAKGGTSGMALILLCVLGFVMVIGIVAAIALPAYQDYVARARLAEAVNYGRSASEAVTRYYGEHEEMPGGLGEAGFESVLPQGVQRADINESGVISLTLKAAPLQGKALIFVPSFDTDRQIVWKCGSQEIPARYLPQQCR